MPKHSIRILSVAEKDISDLIDYIAVDSTSAALNLAEKLEMHILRLEDFPYSGIVPRDKNLARKGYRVLKVESHLVFYCVMDNNIVEVRRVLSGKMDYTFLL
ncbi:MAG TPA: type II toxin-antitoxin system RelE/ParE family toxin [Dissulfurispiraceae bacterium]|nr:type II toxin-antitoxin system RelE/ParE family toxin [Dissulfurispiraceae bacterium]